MSVIKALFHFTNRASLITDNNFLFKRMFFNTVKLKFIICVNFLKILHLLILFTDQQFLIVDLNFLFNDMFPNAFKLRVDMSTIIRARFHFA